METYGRVIAETIHFKDGLSLNDNPVCITPNFLIVEATDDTYWYIMGTVEYLKGVKREAKA